jgi:phenylalanyl-tRNA synthetase beta chain
VARGEAAREGAQITVTNPLSADHSVLRQALVGSLVEVVDGNARHGQGDVAFFEIGKGYGRVGDSPREWWRLGLALAGAFEPGAWNQPRREADLDDAKGAIELLARELGASAPTYAAVHDEPILHPGRSASVESQFPNGDIAISGVVGELHPRLVEDWGLRVRRVIVGELSVAGLAGGSLPIVLSVPPPRVPPIERDLTVDVPDRVPAGDVAAAIRAAGGSLLLTATLVGTYRGHPLGADERSLTYRLQLGGGEKPPSEAEVDAAIGTISGSLMSNLGARIRG